jgi:hypothetical protein
MYCTPMIEQMRLGVSSNGQALQYNTNIVEGSTECIPIFGGLCYTIISFVQRMNSSMTKYSILKRIPSLINTFHHLVC